MQCPVRTMASGAQGEGIWLFVLVACFLLLLVVVFTCNNNQRFAPSYVLGNFSWWIWRAIWHVRD